MEVEDIVRELIASEKDSRNLVDSARKKAKEMISAAEKEGKALLDSKINEAEKTAKDIVEKAEIEAKTRTDNMIKKTQSEMEFLKDSYSKIKDDTISKFVSEIVKGKKRG